MKRRHRRRYAADQHKPSRKPFVRSALGVLVIAAALVYAGHWVLDYFGAGNTIRRIGTTLTLNEADVANVSIEGSEFKRAENGQKLYPGDRVTTNSASQAQMDFFDGSVIRMNELTDISIAETYRGAEASNLSLRLQEGMVWVRTPEPKAFSGTIVRTIETPEMRLKIPPNTEALIQARSIIVYSANGLGVTIKVDESVVPVVVGEGQKFTLPPNAQSADDLYTHRSPLDPTAVQIPFVQESRQLVVQGNTSATGSTAPGENTAPPSAEANNEILTVVSPDENEEVDTATVNVTGTVGENVARVRVNGYNAPINNGTFSQELALPDEDEMDIVIVALGADGATLSEVSRHISRNRTPPEPPTITAPANDGTVYRTNQERLEIRGRAPEGTVGIMVNDYRLQLFEPGDTTWSYLASTGIDNFQRGENVYEITAINAGGYRSEPATITIILGEGEPGVVSDADEETNDDDDTVTDPDTLPQNDPLQPGSLQVTGPTAGSSHTATGSSFLIQGTTSADTETLWVNDYRLRLYEQGKTTWNYIADEELGTLEPGVNTYEIVSRNADNEVLDRFTYTVEY